MVSGQALDTVWIGGSWCCPDTLSVRLSGAHLDTEWMLSGQALDTVWIGGSWCCPDTLPSGYRVPGLAMPLVELSTEAQTKQKQRRTRRMTDISYQFLARADRDAQHRVQGVQALQFNWVHCVHLPDYMMCYTGGWWLTRTSRALWHHLCGSGCPRPR